MTNRANNRIDRQRVLTDRANNRIDRQTVLTDEAKRQSTDCYLEK